MTAVFLTFLLALASFSAPDWRILEQPVYMSSHGPLAVHLFAGDKAAPQKIDVLSLGPRLSAESAIVVDAASGAILFSKNSQAIRPLASLSKLMTAVVFLDAQPNLSQVVAMTEADDREGGRTFIKPGDSATLENYLMASLLGSANNATIVLSRVAGGTDEEFVKKMNDQAKNLGMHDTNFLDPTGLAAANVSSARDMAKFLRTAAANQTLRRLTATRQGVITLADGAVRPILNTDSLLGSIVSIVLGKTGYLDEALYNFAAIAKLKNGAEVYVVVLGAAASDERFQDAKNLVVWTGSTYEWK